MKIWFRSCLVAWVLSSSQSYATTLYNHGSPTDVEQYVVELVNRARANPAAEATRQGIALNSGLAAGTISNTAKQPLAWNPQLISAARAHTASQLANDSFSHTGVDGLSACARALNAGYTSAVTENISLAVSSTPVTNQQAAALARYDALYSSAGHRANTFAEEIEEIGVGFDVQVASILSTNRDHPFITQKFGGGEGRTGTTVFFCDSDGNGVGEAYPWTDQGTFLVGVATGDDNGNGFYDVGEGDAGITITISASGYHAVTSASGGYSVPIPASGSFTVTAVGAGYNHTLTLPANGKNMKLDFVPGTSGGVLTSSRDFDGDGKNDLLWRRITGETVLHFMDNTTLLRSAYTSNSTSIFWKVVGQGDFDGDGKCDILWRHETTGITAIHFMDGETLRHAAYTGHQTSWNYDLAGVGDFNTDGKADLLWRRVTDGRPVIHYMDGAFLQGYNYTSYRISNAWDIAGVADFDADGDPDFLLRRVADGKTAVHFLNDYALVSGAFTSVHAGLDWALIGADDFNGDGKADLVWRKGTATVYHYLNGASYIGAASTDTPVSTAWAPHLE